MCYTIYIKVFYLLSYISICKDYLIVLANPAKMEALKRCRALLEGVLLEHDDLFFVVTYPEHIGQNPVQ